MPLLEAFEKIEDSCEPESFGVAFSWTAKGIGFGEFYFYRDKDGQLMCSNELMGKEFIKRMLCLMVDSCELDCVSENAKKS